MVRKTNLNLVIVTVLGLSALCGSAWAIDGNEPIAHWNFDEGSGTIAYDSVGSNDGTLNGDSSWVTGKVGSHAIELDGDGDYVSIGNAVTHNLPEGTFTAWVYPADLSKVCDIYNFAYIIGADDWAGGELGLRVNGDGSGWGSVQNDVPGGALSFAAGTFSVGSWHHVAMTWGGTYWKLYVNGVEKASELLSEGTSDAYNTALIGKGWAGCLWDGRIDDVRIYERGLSAEEIRELYYAGFSSAELAIMFLEDAIAEKVEMLEVIDETLEKELTAYNALGELLASGDYGDLNKHDIATAQQKVRSAIQRQERSRRSLEESIGRLEDALMALGWEPPADEPVVE